MPLTGIRLKNFKCFADTRPVPLAPLTLIFGQNNSGKSSLLQSLLLLRQSLDAAFYGPRLNLSGPIYAAGTYSDLVHSHNTARRITIELSLPAEDDNFAEPSRRIELTFAADDPDQPRLAGLCLWQGEERALTISRGKGKGGPFELMLGSLSEGNERDANFSFPVNGFLPLIGDEPRRKGRPSKARAETRVWSRGLIDTTSALLSELRVVGAFRAHPERRYEYQGLQEGTDATGRHAVNALIFDSMQTGRAQGALLALVNEWLSKVARVKLLPLIPVVGRLYEPTLSDTETELKAKFPDVGFGIGQALPVLVEGLRTPEGGIFIVQEPEIHLHPDAQLAMADFLVDLMRSGRQVIAETHSEHILLRVRRRMMDAENRLDPDAVSLLHVGRDRAGESRVLSLKLDELGQIENWPTGFMEQATEERMALLEQMAARVEAEG